jgi:peptidyl-Lys metalloendopeptidase
MPRPQPPEEIRTMFVQPHWAVAALASLAVSAHAAPVSKLDVRVSTPAPVLQGDVDVVVDVVVTNPTREVLRVPAAQLPSDDPGTKLFSITRDGQPVPYQGAIVKRAPALNEEVVVIQPGQSLSYQVELTSAYDLSQSGRYAVEYVGLGKQNGAGANTAPMYLWLEGRSARAPLPQASLAVGAAAASLGFTSCSASQQNTITSAVSSATNYARAAASYLAGTPSATSRYTTWFGAFSTAGWNTAKAHFNNEVSAFTTQAVTVDCKCKKANVYAYVYPTQPYKIYVCGAFWQAPLTGTDSKAGTLVHEMSHFNVVAATDDWAYGQSAARSLAISDPAKALDNADSHEYFAENTPAQP